MPDISAHTLPTSLRQASGFSRRCTCIWRKGCCSWLKLWRLNLSRRMAEAHSNRSDHWLKQYQLVFWDFDGVIKDSVGVKTRAFIKLFQAYGPDITEKIRLHHEAHGGMSRFDKFPIYLRWAGEDPTPERVHEFCDRFGQLVLRGVVDAPWVPGVEAYLHTNPNLQAHVLVSATPQDELEEILRALDMHSCFVSVFGAPFSKKEAIRMVLANNKFDPLDCLMIGDSKADLEAAQSNRVPFVLRRHATNIEVFEGYTGASLQDFTDL